METLTRPQSFLSLLLMKEARRRGARGVMGRRKVGRHPLEMARYKLLIIIVIITVFLLSITPRAPFGHASRVPSPACDFRIH